MKNILDTLGVIMFMSFMIINIGIVLSGECTFLNYSGFGLIIVAIIKINSIRKLPTYYIDNEGIAHYLK